MSSASEMHDQAVGWLAVAVAIVSFGSFAAPAKTEAVLRANVHPLVYQTNKTFWCFTTSWLVLLVPGVRLTFTPFGVLSAIAWVPAGCLAIWSVGYAGLAVAQATWSSCIVVVSFAWGAFVFQEHVASWPLAAGSLALMIVSIIGMAHFADPARKHAHRAEMQAVLVQHDAMAEANQGGSDASSADDDGAPRHPRRRPSAGIPEATLGPPLTLPASATPLPPPPQPAVAVADAQRRKRTGILIAVCSGVYGGSFPAGVKAAQALAPGQPVGFEFVISFGVGASVVTALVWLLHWLVLERCFGHPHPRLQLRVMAVPGAIAGLSWSLGNVASIVAVTRLGSALGYSACQASLVVSGLWGILFFREVQGADAVRWLGFAMLCAASVVGLAFQMKSS